MTSYLPQRLYFLLIEFTDRVFPLGFIAQARSVWAYENERLYFLCRVPHQLDSPSDASVATMLIDFGPAATHENLPILSLSRGFWVAVMHTLIHERTKFDMLFIVVSRLIFFLQHEIKQPYSKSSFPFSTTNHIYTFPVFSRSTFRPIFVPSVLTSVRSQNRGLRDRETMQKPGFPFLAIF